MRRRLAQFLRRWRLRARPAAPSRAPWTAVGDGISARDMTPEELRGWLPDRRSAMEQDLKRRAEWLRPRAR